MKLYIWIEKDLSYPYKKSKLIDVEAGIGYGFISFATGSPNTGLLVCAKDVKFIPISNINM